MADQTKPADAVTTTVPEPGSDAITAALVSIVKSKTDPAVDAHGFRTVPDQETSEEETLFGRQGWGAVQVGADVVREPDGA